MSKKVIIFIVLIASISIACWLLLSPSNVKDSEASNIIDGVEMPVVEKMVDTRDPQTVAGGMWTSKLDCTYKNPPPDWTLKSGAVDCEGAKHNIEVLSSKPNYFRPRSTADNEPPFCLVKGPATKAHIAEATAYMRMFCRGK